MVKVIFLNSYNFFETYKSNKELSLPEIAFVNEVTESKEVLSYLQTIIITSQSLELFNTSVSDLLFIIHETPPNNWTLPNGRLTFNKLDKFDLKLLIHFLTKGNPFEQFESLFNITQLLYAYSRCEDTAFTYRDILFGIRKKRAIGADNIPLLLQNSIIISDEEKKSKHNLYNHLRNYILHVENINNIILEMYNTSDVFIKFKIFDFFTALISNSPKVTYTIFHNHSDVVQDIINLLSSEENLMSSGLLSAIILLLRIVKCDQIDISQLKVFELIVKLLDKIILSVQTAQFVTVCWNIILKLLPKLNSLQSDELFNFISNQLTMVINTSGKELKSIVEAAFDVLYTLINRNNNYRIILVNNKELIRVLNQNYNSFKSVNLIFELLQLDHEPNLIPNLREGLPHSDSHTDGIIISSPDEQPVFDPSKPVYSFAP